VLKLIDVKSNSIFLISSYQLLSDKLHKLSFSSLYTMNLYDAVWMCDLMRLLHLSKKVTYVASLLCCCSSLVHRASCVERGKFWRTTL